MTIKLDIGCINKNEKYVLACSFGPDSMALFDMLFKLNCHFVVAFVNYHKRQISNYEQEEIINYCKKLNIQCEVYDVDKEIKGNFQNFARKIRYDFFKKIYRKYHAAGLFVAHQQDDLIETYIMQKKRNNRVDFYGIKSISFLKEMKVIRPLLKYTKQELLNYCHKNNVPFSIDETNFRFDYLRNKIRNKLINLTENDRQKILCEIEQKNQDVHFFRSNLKKKINTNFDRLDIKKIIALDKREFQEVIIQFVFFNLNKFRKHVNISASYINEIYKICLSKKKNIMIPIMNNFFLLKEYGEIVFRKLKKNNNYFYVIKEPCKLVTKEFIIDFLGSTINSKIDVKDYPVVVRSVFDNDKIKIRGCYFKINRIFINWKMPVYFRKRWPVLCNLKNEVLYVPKYHTDFIGEFRSKLVIKF